MVAHHNRELREIDAEILRLAHEGKRKEACRQLAQAYGGEILGTCIARLGDEAAGADAAQDALSRALVALPSYRGTAGLRPWLHRIAANRCIDMMRSRQSKRGRLAADFDWETLPAPSRPMPSEQAEVARERQLQLERVRSALASVKEPDRRWVELHYTHGVSYDEIAREEGLSRAAVKQRIWRAVKKVRAALGGVGGR